MKSYIPSILYVLLACSFGIVAADTGLAVNQTPLATTMPATNPSPTTRPSPKRVTGVFKGPSGDIPFSAEYWGKQDTMGEAALPFTACLDKMNKSKSFEELTSCYTKGSRPYLESRRSTIEHLIEQRETEAQKTKVRRILGNTQRLRILVKTGEGADQIEFVALAETIHLKERDLEIGTFVFAFGEEDGVQKRVANQEKHPIYKALKAGKWAQFGAPEDRQPLP